MPKIMLAEEESPGRESLALNLRAAGIEVLTALSGPESLQLACEQPPDLLILDLRLPHLDGLTLARLLRRCAEVTVLMLAPNGPEGQALASLEVTANDYVIKPVDPAELMDRVRALLCQAPSDSSSPATRLQSGNLWLDLIARRATLDELPLKLTQKEFDLLAELMRHRGAVLSRDQLLTRVWGRHHAGSSHTVDVHVRWLREKIEANPSVPARILTVRGAGYRFTA
jgi:DNA-binding response OmpR family regulator